MVNAELIGIENVQKIIKGLPRELGQYAIQSATLSASTIIQKALRQAAPRSRKPEKYQNKWKYGHLADNIKKKRVENANLKTTYLVYVPRKIYWAKWLEEGTDFRPAVKRKPGAYRRANLGNRTVEINNTGRMPRRPFFNRTVDRAFPAARKRLMDTIWDRTQKAVANLNGKYSRYKGRVKKSQRIF